MIFSKTQFITKNNPPYHRLINKICSKMNVDFMGKFPVYIHNTEAYIASIKENMLFLQILDYSKKHIFHDSDANNCKNISKCIMLSWMYKGYGGGDLLTSKIFIYRRKIIAYPRNILSIWYYLYPHNQTQIPLSIYY